MDNLTGCLHLCLSLSSTSSYGRPALFRLFPDGRRWYTQCRITDYPPPVAQLLLSVRTTVDTMYILFWDNCTSSGWRDRSQNTEAATVVFGQQPVTCQPWYLKVPCVFVSFLSSCGSTVLVPTKLYSPVTFQYVLYCTAGLADRSASLPPPLGVPLSDTQTALPVEEEGTHLEKTSTQTGSVFFRTTEVDELLSV